MKIFTKTKIITGITMLVITGILMSSCSENQNEFEYITVQKSNLVQKISVTGKVRPIDEVHLTFEQNGKIDQVLAKVGDHVEESDILVRMTNKELLAQRLQAQAQLEGEQARLQNIINGAKNEEIVVSERRIDQAETNESEAQKNLMLQIQNAYTTVDHVVRDQADRMFSNPLGKSPRITFRSANSRLENDINNQRFYIGLMLNEWGQRINRLRPELDLLYYTIEAKENLKKTKAMLENIALVLNHLLPNSRLPQAQIDSWKNDIAQSRTEINSALNAIRQAEEKLASAQASVDVSDSELELTQSGPSPDEINIQKAQIKAAQAQIQSINAQIEKTILKAPFAGTLTKMEAKEGEVISLSSMKEILVSMIGDGYEIELNVPEMDIAKVNIGDQVDLKFDAFEDETFQSQVTFIEPAQTEMQGVTYYQVKIELDPTSIKLPIRSGMAVDTDIITAEKSEVILVPQRLIIRKDEGKFIRTLKEIQKKERTIFGKTLPDFLQPKEKILMTVEAVPVETGLNDSLGQVEVSKGLQDGDKIVTSREE